MIKLEGTVLNVFVQQGGKDKKQVTLLMIATRFKFWVLWSFQTVVKMNFLLYL